MRILFTTERVTAPSAELNAASLAKLGDIDGVTIDFRGRDYAGYDVVLFMGYDADVAAARAAREDLIVGVVDPRPTLPAALDGADFLLVNGLEARDWYAGVADHIFVYPIFPELPAGDGGHERGTDGLVLGYHGNTTHLRAMHPRITAAISRLAQEVPVELRAMYNAGGGTVHTGLEGHDHVAVRHVPWSVENYGRELAAADVGLVPGLMPVSARACGAAVADAAAWASHASDYLLHFKATSNAGRIYVFAHYGIPVVADMYPSALTTIDDGVDGFVCYSPGAWWRALAQLARDAEMRRRMGARLKAKLDPEGTRERVNRGLVEFISRLDGSGRVRTQTGPAVAAQPRRRSGSLLKRFTGRR